MAEIKLNKTELKQQKNLLDQLRKYLPTLQLKQQQLQVEVDSLTPVIEEVNNRILNLKTGVEGWAELLTEKEDFVIYELAVVSEVVTDLENIAGVDVPIFEKVEFKKVDYSLFMTPIWVDQARETMRDIVSLREEVRVIVKKQKLLAEELRQTNIKVNLFEKRMIPECMENIRKIRIFLGDQEIAAICNAKIAKEKLDRKARKRVKISD
ncbi:MAG TPA: V-type ATP synthase subunit D [Spirochaetales bacterium]|nr:V-type ATP synthase subunit D [Spirochaetales bacterium]